MRSLKHSFLPISISERWRTTMAPKQRQRLLQRLRRPAWLGTIRRTTPLSDHWGYDRGTPVDRYYIEQFLKEHRQDIHGRVLEVKDSDYTDRYGSDVDRRDVLDIDPSNPRATIIADLSAADAIQSDQFDCFVLTQTLQLIYDTRAAMTHAHRILRPGGTLLVTVPTISRIAPRWPQSDYWRFTTASCSALFGNVFGAEQVSIYSYGNALTAICFIMGVAHEELSRRELETHDQYFPVMIAVRAVKRPEIGS
jgi:SAM-dependent methyltransferase